MKYYLSTIVIVLIIISCIHGKTMYFPEGKDLNNPVEVIIMRNKNFNCGAHSTAIFLDELPIAYIRRGEYVSFFVESGVHYLRVRGNGIYGNFEKEKKYYFLISINFFDVLSSGSLFGKADPCGFEIEKINEEEGLKRIMNSKKLIKMEKEYKIPTEAAAAEKEKPELASIPKGLAASPIELRRQPTEISSEAQVTKILKKYGFFEKSKNIDGSFYNHFVDNENGTVTDKATGLMWQMSGSSSSLDNRSAKEYIEQLNRQRFAGYADWRMPTIEELASLLKRTRRNGVYIDPVFDHSQTTCWSADKGDVQYYWHFRYWIVNFKQGEILQANFIKPNSIYNFPSYKSKNETNYVKAVRSAR